MPLENGEGHSIRLASQLGSIDKCRLGPIIYWAEVMCCLAICASLSKPPPSMPIMINQGSLFMLRNLLILGGTTEASSLAYLISKTKFNATISYAGRVGRVRQQPIQKRIGGFGGVDGLSSYIISEGITHLVDATHPFATQISHNAILACQKTGIPLAALTRPKWEKQEGDKWCLVPDIDAASDALNQSPKRVMLAIGRMQLARFYENLQHFYLLRLVDEPKATPLFPNHVIEISRGPFTTGKDKLLLTKHRINLIVAKNAGGNATYSKVEAARQLGIEIIMIDRPKIPERRTFFSPEAVVHWLSFPG